MVPANDLEALEIIGLLRRVREEVLVSRQSHGATWTGLEAEIQRRIATVRSEEPERIILGVELGGGNSWGAINIDHHRYRDEDRSHPLSSLEQVAMRLGVKLDRRQKLVALNDRGWILAMQEAGASSEEIRSIRDEDIRAQGHGYEARGQAGADIAAARRIGRCLVVRCPGGVNPWHSDLLFGQADELLLLGQREWSYSGPRHLVLMALNLGEVRWSGGGEACGYFGILEPGAGAQQAILELLFGTRARRVRDLVE